MSEIGIAVKQMGLEAIVKLYGKKNVYERNLCN